MKNVHTWKKNSNSFSGYSFHCFFPSVNGGNSGEKDIFRRLFSSTARKKKLKSNLKNFTNEKNRKRKCHVIVWKKYLDQQLTSDSENVFLTLLRNLFFLLRMFFFSFQKNFLIKQKQNLVSCVRNNKKYFKKQIVTQFHTGSLVFFHISVFKTFHIFFSLFHSVSHKKSLKMTVWMNVNVFFSCQCFFTQMSSQQIQSFVKRLFIYFSFCHEESENTFHAWKLKKKNFSNDMWGKSI